MSKLAVMIVICVLATNATVSSRSVKSRNRDATTASSRLNEFFFDDGEHNNDDDDVDVDQLADSDLKKLAESTLDALEKETLPENNADRRRFAYAIKDDERIIQTLQPIRENYFNIVFGVIGSLVGIVYIVYTLTVAFVKLRANRRVVATSAEESDARKNISTAASERTQNNIYHALRP